MNEWKVSGEVFYLKDLQGEFAASLKLRGKSKRPGSITTQILEFACLMTQPVYDEAKRLGLRQYHTATLSGHFETWDKNGKPKNYYIADQVLEVGGYK